MKFVIDRSKWRCGGNSYNKQGLGETQLLNEEGYMCCLGQISCQLGIPENKLLGYGTPSSLNIANILCHSFEYYGSPIYRSSVLASKAMQINDNGFLSNKEREIRLIELFNDHHHELEFVDNAEPNTNTPD